MQLVLSGNRVISHGEDCFLAMGGTVICTQTGRVFQNATVAECENCPSDIDTVGYEYHAGVFIPCAPYGKDNGEGTLMVACEECGTPKDSGIPAKYVLPRKVEITLTAVGWTDRGAGRFTQKITTDVSTLGGTDNTRVALDLSYQQAKALMEAGTSFLQVNNEYGAFEAVALDAKPSVDMTIQATLTEVIG